MSSTFLSPIHAGLGYEYFGVLSPLLGPPSLIPPVTSALPVITSRIPLIVLISANCSSAVGNALTIFSNLAFISSGSFFNSVSMTCLSTIDRGLTDFLSSTFTAVSFFLGVSNSTNLSNALLSLSFSFVEPSAALSAFILASSVSSIILAASSSSFVAIFIITF